MYYSYTGQEIEDAEMDAMREDARADAIESRQAAQKLQAILDAINASPTYSAEEEAYIISLHDRINELKGVINEPERENIDGLGSDNHGNPFE